MEIDSSLDRLVAPEVLLDAYRRWLREERGLATESVRCYSQQSKKFLESLSGPVGPSLASLKPADITGYVVGVCAGSGSVWSVKAHVTALRSFLRFLHVSGRIPAALAPVVPGVAGWRLSQVPRALPRGHVESLLDCHDTDTVTGLRDRAVLTLLAVLGLRGAEAAALQLGDIDWPAGLITVVGKGSRVEQLPLPATAGQALDGLPDEGPPGRDRVQRAFPDAPAPLAAADPGSGTSDHAPGLCQGRHRPRGAHRLRHTLATDLLRAGASLPDIGQVLRHRSQLSTTIYAKVDHDRLRALARPWPGTPAIEGVVR